MHLLKAVLIFCQFKLAELLNCTVYLQSNGSALCKLSEEARSSCGTDWTIKGINVASEDEVNTTLVIWRRSDSLLLKSYYANIAFNEDCIATGRREVSCLGPVLVVSEAPHKEDHTWIIWPCVAVGFLVLISLSAMGFCWWKKKSHGPIDVPQIVI